MQINYYGQPENTKVVQVKETDQAIANTIIERMFLACATDEQVKKYYQLLEVGGHKGRGLATSYASRIVLGEFLTLLSARYGIDYKEL